MKITKVILKEFKAFDDLTIDLGTSPKRIIAIVGPNGCGKSSIFDAFEEKLKDFRNHGREDEQFYSKAAFYKDGNKGKTMFHECTNSPSIYNKHQSIKIEATEHLKRTSFYIRTAYRSTAKLNIQQFEAFPSILETNDEPISSIAFDQRLEYNYKRLVGISYSEFFKGDKTGEIVRKELLEKINNILNKILGIEISDLGNILEKKGQLYFTKGNVKDFPYANLSSGEKEIVDIILDFFIKTKEYRDTVFCIDEPELHLNTAIQRKLLIEIEKLLPDDCQLWVATHSIGFLRALQEDLKDKSQVIDFSKEDYCTGTHTIVPIETTRNNWQRIFRTALDDLTKLVCPKRIIYCEGKDRPGVNGEEQGLDAIVFNNIFGEKYPDTLFVSSGGNTEPEQRSAIALNILKKALVDVEIWILKDKDDENREDYLKSKEQKFRILKRLEIENYLFDKEVLKKDCLQNNRQFNEIEYDKLVEDITMKDIKNETERIKKICAITKNAKTFKVDLSKCITEDMAVYKELEQCIFERK